MEVMLSLRLATTDDAAALAVMNKQLIEDEKHENPMTVAELEGRMRGWLSSDYAAYLFLDGSGIAGYTLIQNTVEPIYLRQFFIARDRRRQGLGRAAFRILMQELKSPPVDLDVLSWNTAAAAFWQSVGFIPRSTRMQLRKKNGI